MTRTALDRVYERSDGICHICLLHVPRDVDSLHPLSPTRDHMQPRRLGNMRNPMFNMVLAHRWCNNRRGHMPVHTVYKEREIYQAHIQRLLDKRVTMAEES